MDTMASQITSLMIVYLTVYSDADQRKHQGSASLAFVRGIHRGPGNHTILSISEGHMKELCVNNSYKSTKNYETKKHIKPVWLFYAICTIA